MSNNGSTGSKRGRKPKDGVAKTNTQRVQEIRLRDDLAIKSARTAEDYQKFTTRLLLKAMEDAVKNGYQVSARKIAAELIKRADPDVVFANDKTNHKVNKDDQK